MAIKLHSSFAVHPGAWLRAEIVTPRGLSVTDAAAKLHVTQREEGDLLGGRPELDAHTKFCRVSRGSLASAYCILILVGIDREAGE
ncbi:hypothetical protein [Sphingomonas psychrolutea]|uniref:hypothetical protein n=1 Tax=Sphingomonas psychrolutea TaxID=1259676 RepID=UPI001662E68E|nr:hypothetical protein [Sphingomonas psychrolutea]